MDSPKISVCLLAYNSANHIKTAVDSVLAQSFSDWEMLISDDASKDGTEQVITPYLSDPRIRYVRHERNLGQAGNWAYAFENTKAPFIATLHADDAWVPETLALFQQAIAQSDHMDLIWGSWTRTTGALVPMAHQPVPDKDRDWLGDDILRHVFLSNSILPSASAFRRDLLGLIGLPHLSYGMMCDRDWWVRAAAAARMARSISQSLVLYRIHDESVTSNFTNDGRLVRELDDFHTRLPELLKKLPDRDTLIKNYELGICDFYFRLAISQKVAGFEDQANTRMRQAMKLHEGRRLGSKELIKFILFHLGGPGKWLLSHLHEKNRWITAPLNT